MFKVGDEVICVDDTKGWAHTYITVGEVYVVKTKGWAHTYITVGEVYVVKTVTNNGLNLSVKTGKKGESIGFYSHRFIPNTPEAKAEWMRKKLEEE